MACTRVLFHSKFSHSASGIASYGVHKFEAGETSVESRDSGEGGRLWDVSSKLVGLA